MFLFPFFKDEETDFKKLNELPKVTELVNGRIPVNVTPKLMLRCPQHIKTYRDASSRSRKGHRSTQATEQSSPGRKWTSCPRRVRKNMHVFQRDEQLIPLALQWDFREGSVEM